jgi:hypothetical protein
LCGLFGAVGFGWSEGTIRALTWANQERGTDSLGFFDSSGKMIKAAETPSDALRQENISKWLAASCCGSEKMGRKASWFIAGHTRLATRGKVNRQNSHPFRYGKIVGSHNGMIDAPKGYVVDSQHLFDTLNKTGGDYNTAWADVTGYWGVTWYDGESFYLQIHNGDLTVARIGELWYYSSSWAHLESCIGPADESITLKEGQTIRFTLVNGKVEKFDADVFTSNAPDYWVRKYGCSNASSYQTGWDDPEANRSSFRRHGGSEKGTWYDQHGTSNTTTTTPTKDYDAEWRSAWEDYCTDSEHTKIS